jgi:hypothetical protein
MSVLTRFLSTAAELSGVGGYIQAVKDALAAPVEALDEAEQAAVDALAALPEATRAQILKIADEVRRSE